MSRIARRFLSSSGIWSRYQRDDWTNVPARLEAEWLGRGLLTTQDHPLARIWQRAQGYFGKEFECRVVEDPVVSVHDNFDALLFPADHVGRSRNDTYYVNRTHVLRTHCTAHQRQMLMHGPPSWLVAGDVFRRDEIDATHFPVFHQVDAARVMRNTTTKAAELEMKHLLEGFARQLLAGGDALEMRWRDDYFPFTTPSWELDVNFRGKWLELLGCGLIHPDIMRSIPTLPSDAVGWAFGVGLERLAMVVYGVPDIRLFWSRDQRFLAQFAGRPLDAAISFVPFSKYPLTSRDVSFWLPGDGSFHDNAFFEAVRECAGDLVEGVTLVDSFVHPKTGRASRAFRIDYRSMERSLTNAEVNAIQERVRDVLAKQLQVELR